MKRKTKAQHYKELVESEPDLVPIEEVRKLIRAHKDSQIMGDDGALAATRRAAEALYEVDDVYFEYADGGISGEEFVSKVEKALGYTGKIKAALWKRET